MFLLTCMLPYQLFSNTLTKSMAAFESNQGLFNRCQVRPFDALVTRCLVECLVYLLVFLILVAAGMALGFDAVIDDFLGLSLTLLLLVWFSFSMGLLCSVIESFAENFKKVVGTIMRRLFFLSGIFFSVSMLPQYHGIVLLNPTDLCVGQQILSSEYQSYAPPVSIPADRIG